MIQKPNSDLKGTTLKEREKLWRKKEILKVASRFFASKGFHQTKMSDIAKATGYSVGLLYELFDSKENLYILVLSEKIDKLLERLSEVTQAEATPEAKLEKFVETYGGFFVREKDFFQIFTREHLSFRHSKGEMLRERMRQGLLRILNIIRGIIQEGSETGAFNAPSVEVCSAVVIGSIHSTLGLWLMGDITEPPDVLIENLKNIIKKAVKGKQ